MIPYNNKVSITVFELLYVSMQANKLSDNKNVLKNIQSNAQAGVLVQFNLIYERQTLLICMDYARYRNITGSNAQISECTLFWQHKRQEQCMQSLQQNLYIAEWGKQQITQHCFNQISASNNKVQQQRRQIGVQSQIKTFDAFMHISILKSRYVPNYR